MQLTKGALVYRMDDHPAGRLTHIVIDPATQEVTHLVMRCGMPFKTAEKVIPLKHLHCPTAEHLTLRADAPDLDAFPAFEESYYAPVAADEEYHAAIGSAGNLFLNPPVDGFVQDYSESRQPSRLGERYALRTKQNIPENTIAVREGAQILSEDGQRVGHLESVLVDAETHRLKQIMIAPGIWPRYRRLLPADWVDLISPDIITLSVAAAAVRDTPHMN